MPESFKYFHFFKNTFILYKMDLSELSLSESIKKYISLHKQCIIVISGFNGCRKSQIIKDLSKE